MAKNNRKNSGKKRNLKYGNIALVKADKEKSGNGVKYSKKDPASKENRTFKKEIRKNLVFIASFFAALVVIYFLLTKTSVLNPVLNLFGLSGLYNR